MLVAADLFCHVLPEPPTNTLFKLLEFNDECETEFVAFDAKVTKEINALKGVPKAGVQRAVWSKSVGDLIKETGVSGLMRIAELGVRAAKAELEGYAGTDLEKFRAALEKPFQLIISSAPKGKSGYPQVLTKEDITLARVRVMWEVETALALMKKAVREEAPPPLPVLAGGGDGSGGTAAVADTLAAPDVTAGRHDLKVRRKAAYFSQKMPSPANPSKLISVPDPISYGLHVVLTAPRVATRMVAIAMLGQHPSARPRVYAGKEGDSRPEPPWTGPGLPSAFQLVAELASRGLATAVQETIPNRKEITEGLGLRGNASRNFIRVIDVGKLSVERRQSYGTEILRLGLTLQQLDQMNNDVLPMDAAEVVKWGVMADVNLVAMAKGTPAAEERAAQAPSSGAAASHAVGACDRDAETTIEGASASAPAVHQPSELEQAHATVLSAADESMLRTLSLVTSAHTPMAASALLSLGTSACAPVAASASVAMTHAPVAMTAASASAATQSEGGTLPDDALGRLVQARAQKEQEDAAMILRVHNEMSAIMDTGVRVNPSIAEALGVTLGAAPVAAVALRAASPPPATLEEIARREKRTNESPGLMGNVRPRAGDA